MELIILHLTLIITSLRTCLMRCSVWLRVDRVRRPLEAPYQGPFLVLKRSPKTFVLQKPNGREMSVTIDRLKPAIISSPSPSDLTFDRFDTRSTNVTSQNSSPQTETVTSHIPDGSSQSSTSQVPTRTQTGRTVKFNPKPDYY
ncbi:Uncharacterised protein r2_g154 [Pycnogonum litorale]